MASPKPFGPTYSMKSNLTIILQLFHWARWGPRVPHWAPRNVPNFFGDRAPAGPWALRALTPRSQKKNREKKNKIKKRTSDSSLLAFFQNFLVMVIGILFFAYFVQFSKNHQNPTKGHVEFSWKNCSPCGPFFWGGKIRFFSNFPKKCRIYFSMKLTVKKFRKCFTTEFIEK